MKLPRPGVYRTAGAPSGTRLLGSWAKLAVGKAPQRPALPEPLPGDPVVWSRTDDLPYTKTGGNGVYERRHEMPEAFHVIGKHRRADWVGTLLDREELVMAMAQGSKLVKGLDVLGGPVASGQVGTVRPQGERDVPGFPVVSL